MNRRALLTFALTATISCDPAASPADLDGFGDEAPSARSIPDGQVEGGNPGFLWHSLRL